MLLIDSNIIIYASKPEYKELRSFLEANKGELAASAISMVEALSFKMPASQKKFIEEFFHSIEIFPVSDPIVEKAKALQEKKKLGAADALIASTALENKAKLITSNISDFRKVNDLVLINPFE